MTLLSDQFRHPRGLLGRLVGHVMALKNERRSRWALSLLGPAEGEHVLEVGFGSGADVARLLVSVGPRGHVTGVDVSATMVRQAAARNRAAIRRGLATLERASAEHLPYRVDTFDAVFSINCAQFFGDTTRALQELYHVTRAGGRMVVAVQPMARGATRAHSEEWGRKLTEAAEQAGWTRITVHYGPTTPPVVAVVAFRGT